MEPRRFAPLLLGLALGACRSEAPRMASSTEALAEAPPDMAQVVFLRPLGWAGNQLVTVVDGEGRFVGALPAITYFATNVEPGKRRFVAWADNTAVLEADVAAGRTYFVEVALRAGAWGPRVELLGYGPDHPRWSMLPAWLADCRRLTPIAPRGAAWAARNAAAIGEHTARAAAAPDARGELEARDGLEGMPFADVLTEPSPAPSASTLRPSRLPRQRPHAPAPAPSPTP